MKTRNTIQRSIVLDMVRKLKNHATADEIHTEVIKFHPYISKGTVYRNLQKLCELGKISKRQIPGEADRYDHVCSNHYHGKCVVCSKIFDLELPYKEELDHSPVPSEVFEVLKHDIIFSGICSACKEKNRNKCYLHTK